MPGRRRRGILGLVIALAAPACAAVGTASAAEVTNAADSARTGWYPNQSALTPELVKSSSFGQMFKTNLAVGDQIDAEPLVVGDTVIVVTEQNRAYGIDAASGAVKWQRGPTKPGGALDLGNPMRTAEETRDPTVAGDAGCDVPRRTTGITGTPVVDTATNTAYFYAKHYVAGNDGALAYTMHAVDVDSGAERPGFPRDVLNGMKSDNHPTSDPDFTAQWELQRPGLLLMNGVVYSAYAGHCDRGHYEGWVVGMSAASGAVTGRWVSVATTPGAGIWQSGGGLVSDGPGRILFTTGNGRSPTGDAPLVSPPNSLGSSVVRLQVAADGKLSTADFFSVYDGDLLDRNDVDFGSGGPVALPDAYFGTADHPHLMVAAGKQGIVYLLDRDHLGGYRTGAGGGDNVLQAAGTIGGIWSRPSIWPGDGGWLWVNTASGSGGGCCGNSGRLEALGYGVTGGGLPRFTIGQGESADVFALDSGAPVITSDGAADGTGIVWIVRAPWEGWGAELRAYRAVPDAATKRPVLLDSWPIGRSNKFAPPGVGSGRVFVATRGCLKSYEAACTADTPAALLSYGSPTVQPLTGGSLGFPDTEVGSTANLTATLTATRTVTVTGVTSSDTAFAKGSPSPAVPTTLHAGDTINVPVTFKPSEIGTVTATLSFAVTDGTTPGTVDVGLSGEGITPAPLLRPITPVSFGGVVVGGHKLISIPLSNAGGAPLQVTGLGPLDPAKGFSLPARPPLPFTIPGGQNRVLDIAFDPKTTGAAQDTLHVASTGGNIDVVLSAISATAPHVDVTPQTLDFGDVVVGQAATRSFTVHNRGGSAATITRSQPPGGAIFSALTPLSEGTTLVPGETRTLTVRFQPTALGLVTNGWSINADDGLGQRNLAFTGTGVATPPAPGPDDDPPVEGPVPRVGGTSRPPDLLPPALSGARVTGRSLRLALGEAATARIVVQRLRGGRRVARRCVVPTARNRRAPACTRVVTVKTITKGLKAGTSSLTLPKLAAGKYRLVVTVADAQGNRSVARMLRYVVLAAATPVRRHAG